MKRVLVEDVAPCMAAYDIIDPLPLIRAMITNNVLIEPKEPSIEYCYYSQQNQSKSCNPLVFIARNLKVFVLLCVSEFVYELLTSIN